MICCSKSLVAVKTTLRSSSPCSSSRPMPSAPRVAPAARLSRPRSSMPRALAPGLRPEPWTGTDDQNKALQQLRERLSSSPATKSMVPDDEVLRWYLRDRYFDVKEAEEKLSSMLSWKKDFQPECISAESVSKEMASGKAFVHQHVDNYGRPAIVIRVKLHKVGEYPIEDSKRLCVHLIDEALNRLPDDGEQIVGIFDMRDFQVPQNADFAFARFMVEAFFEYYPRRVGQVLFVEAPWVFYPAWEVIKPLMRKYAALVRFVELNDLSEEFFSPETLPADFKRC